MEDVNYEIAPQFTDNEFKKPVNRPAMNVTKTYNNESSTKKKISFFDYARDNSVVVIIFAVIIVLLICVILYYTVFKEKLYPQNPNNLLPVKNPTMQYPGPYYSQYNTNAYRGPNNNQPMNQSMNQSMNAQIPTIQEKNAHLEDILSQTADLDTDDEDIDDNNNDNNNNDSDDDDDVYIDINDEGKNDEHNDTIENALNNLSQVD